MMLRWLLSLCFKPFTDKFVFLLYFCLIQPFFGVTLFFFFVCFFYRGFLCLFFFSFSRRFTRPTMSSRRNKSHKRDRLRSPSSHRNSASSASILREDQKDHSLRKRRKEDDSLQKILNSIETLKTTGLLRVSLASEGIYCQRF